MRLERCGPDDFDGIAAWIAVADACHQHDSPWEVPPTADRLGLEMRFGWAGEVPQFYLAKESGRVLGTVSVFVSDRENTDLAWIDLQIAPEFRRQGFGTAAARAACDLVLEQGRPSVIFEGGWDSPAAHGFAASLGIGLGQVLVRRIQDLEGTADEVARFTSLRDDAASGSVDYDLVRIAGQTPPELLDALVEATEAINDAPADGLVYEDEAHDVDRIRAFEQAQRDADMRLYRVIALERSTGAVAGHTVISVYGDQPTFAEQDDTTVVRRHRGHRLGLRLKADMLCWLAEAEPQVRRVLTENAESNDHMIAVNERLGYVIAGRQLAFQTRLGAD